MEHRIKQLELKLAEQERVNAAMCEDIKSLKEIQNGDRKEYRTSFEHYEEKKKKFSAVLREVNGRTTALQDQQERLATKAELQTLSDQLDGLKTLVDRTAAGMHAAGSSPGFDLVGFSPAQSLINFDEHVVSPTRSLASLEQITEAHSLEPHISKSISPLPDLSNHEAVQSARSDSEDVPSVRSSETERGPSPIVQIPPHAQIAQATNEEQTARLNKRVRFDLRIDSTPSDSGSEDPLAPNATLRKNLRSKKTTNIAASNKASPLDTSKSSKPSRRESAGVPKFSGRKPAGVLDQFKDGSLVGDSDDEDQGPTQLQTQAQVQPSDSQDTEATIDLAKRAVASLVEAAADETASGTRRSGRAPKPKDFGDVEVHGWRTKRARKS